jgi:5-methylcytosine-specific restriction protein A
MGPKRVRSAKLTILLAYMADSTQNRVPTFGAMHGGEPLADDDQVRREKSKARELRASQWWKNQCGRGQCHYCRRRVPPRELTMDHIVPLIRGGLSRKSNVVPCCKDCNSRKKHLLPIEWQDYLDDLARRSEHP